MRTAREYHGELGHLRNSILIPISELEDRIGEVEQYKEREIVAYCSHAIRSATAAKTLTRNGFNGVSLLGD